MQSLDFYPLAARLRCCNDVLIWQMISGSPAI